MVDDLTKRVNGKELVDVYHGTSRKHLDNIRKHGLLSPAKLAEKGEAPRNWPAFQHLNVSTKPNVSKEFAFDTCRQEKGFVQSCQDAPNDPVVLHAKVPRGKLKLTRTGADTPHLGWVASGHIKPEDLEEV